MVLETRRDVVGSRRLAFARVAACFGGGCFLPKLGWLLKLRESSAESICSKRCSAEARPIRFAPIIPWYDPLGRTCAGTGSVYNFVISASVPR